MHSPPASAGPFRIAIVGAGPSGFFLADRLLGQTGVPVTVDLYERLPSPYGLVRYGVAPDHEKIRNVTRTFDKAAGKPGFRFFGNVDVGRVVDLDTLRRHYHAICFTSGAPTDRRMEIPGEDLAGSHAATEFVAWYNGHPDYRDCVFDLSAERVVVVGVGNVAVDVARILCRSPAELETTDIADHALEALRASNVREVTMLGRRGPAQAAFTNPEVRELGELADADIAVRADEVALDPLSRAALDAEDDKATRKKLEILTEFSARERTGKSKLLTIRFLVSPVELVDEGTGRVAAVRVVRNRLVEGRGGNLRPEPTGEIELLPATLVFRSVGYRGVAIAGLPFDERSCTVPNEQGRVVDPAAGAQVPGMYVSGWIKRGPSGVIGTNKPDAAETAEAMLEDLATGRAFAPASPDPEAVLAMLAERAPGVVTWESWCRIADCEMQAGTAAGRPRVKFTTRDDLLRASKTE